MLSITSNLGDERHVSYVSVSDVKLERVNKYLVLGYSAHRVSEICNVRIPVVRMMKAALK